MVAVGLALLFAAPARAARIVVPFDFGWRHQLLPPASPTEVQAGPGADPPRGRPRLPGPWVRQLRHHFGPNFARFSAPHHPTRAVYHALRRAHTDRELIGAWNPMLCPIWDFRWDRVRLPHDGLVALGAMQQPVIVRRVVQLHSPAGHVVPQILRAARGLGPAQPGRPGRRRIGRRRIGGDGTARLGVGRVRRGLPRLRRLPEWLGKETLYGSRHVLSPFTKVACAPV